MTITSLPNSVPAENAGSQAPTPAVQTTSASSDIKEWVAAALAFAIVGFALWALYTLFKASTPFPNMSSVVQTAIGLAGTVTGYYFGRIPAERATQQANQAAGHANAAAQKAVADEARLRGQVAAVRRQFTTPIAGALRGAAASSTDAEALRLQVLDQLDQIK